jgi:hypothetical protein
MSYIPEIVDSGKAALCSPGFEGTLEQGVPPFIPRIADYSKLDIQDNAKIEGSVASVAPPPSPSVAPQPAVQQTVAQQPAMEQPAVQQPQISAPGGFDVDAALNKVGSVGTSVIEKVKALPLKIKILIVAAPVVFLLLLILAISLIVGGSDSGYIECSQYGDGPALMECLDEMTKRGYLE